MSDSSAVDPRTDQPGVERLLSYARGGDVSLDDMNRAMDRSVMRLGHVLADPGPSPSAPVRQREGAVALADQLAKLKPDDRDVIVLRNLQGLSFEEVAERMGRKPGAV